MDGPPTRTRRGAGAPGPRVLAWLLLAAALAGCGPSDGGARPRGVVLVLLDTLRADRLGCYGNARATSPRLDALAAEGARFETVVSAAPWTMPSVGALLAARPPETAYDRDWRLASSVVEAFRDAGFETAAFTEGAFVSRHFGMDRGFDVFVEEEGAFHAVVDGRRLDADAPLTGGIARTFRRAAEWLERVDDRPFFLLVHTYEVHTPYTRDRFASGEGGRIGARLDVPLLDRIRGGDLEPTPDEVAHGVDLYDGGVRVADRHVGRLLDRLEELGLAEETVVAVTSDHGEEFGEHHPPYVFDHGHSLRDDLLLVPLILHDPTRPFGGRVVRPQVRTIDVLPTLAELAGVALPEGLDGASLVPLLEGDERAPRLAVSSQPQAGPPRVSLRDGRYRLVVTTDGEVGEPWRGEALADVRLFDLAGPEPSRDVAEAEPALADALRATLDRWRRAAAGDADAAMDRTATPRALDEEHLERLRALGYVR